MSLSKIVTLFIIILVLFAGFIAYQFTNTSDKKTSQPDNRTTSKAKATINGHTLNLEVVKTPTEQQRGLSNRDTLDKNNGMLFLFNKSDYYPFWMKDMRFAIDVIYIEGDKIVFIAPNVPSPATKSSIPQTIHPNVKAEMVLEINAGLSEEYNIKKGDSIKIDL